MARQRLVLAEEEPRVAELLIANVVALIEAEAAALTETSSCVPRCGDLDDMP